MNPPAVIGRIKVSIRLIESANIIKEMAPAKAKRALMKLKNKALARLSPEYKRILKSPIS